jgi:hypothetical protein
MISFKKKDIHLIVYHFFGNDIDIADLWCSRLVSIEDNLPRKYPQGLLVYTKAKYCLPLFYKLRLSDQDKKSFPWLYSVILFERSGGGNCEAISDGA